MGSWIVHRRHAISIVVAAVIGLVAAAGELHFIPIRHVETARLARLAAAGPPVGFTSKSRKGNVVPASSNPFAGVVAAAKRSPHATGSYSVQWSGASSSNDVASALVSLLPSTSQAAAVQSQATTNYLGPQSFKALSYRLSGRFTVPGVPDASGATYAPASGNAAHDTAVVVQRVGRVVAVSFVRTSGTVAEIESTAQSLAKTEYRHLHNVVPGFTLIRTTWPIVATLLYSGIALLLAALVVVGPLAMRRVREGRRLAREATTRRQVMSRGGKIAKRHSASRR